jgi:hypothetical protein
VAETIVVAFSSDNVIVDCVFLRCGTQRSYESFLLWQSSPLILFGLVLLVRVLFLAREHALLLRVIAYYKRVHEALVVPIAQRVGPLDAPGHLSVKTSTISFTDKVRDLFRGDRRSTWTTYVLIISVFVQISFWYSPDTYYGSRAFRL